MKEKYLYCAVLLLSASVMNQGYAENDEKYIEEIVVTAQKRSENLQNVPIAISVVTAEDLNRLDMTNPSELEHYVPSLNFGDSVHPRGEGFTLRGVGSSTFSVAVESSVGAFIDGVVVGQYGAMVFDFADLKQVEVLRGPQGTLFGKNTTAGMLNITTNRPDLEGNSGELRVTGTQRDGSHGRNQQTNKVEAIGNLVLGENLGLRLVAARSEQDGWVRNVFNGKNVQGFTNTGIIAKLLWQPNDDLEVYFTASYSDSDTDCCTWTTRTPDETGALFAAQGPVVPDEENEEINQNQPSFYDMDMNSASLEVNYQLGEHVLTSVTGVRSWKIKLNLDTDHRPTDLFDRNFGDTEQDQFSQEIRLLSPTGRTVEYQVGLYYYTQDVDSRTNQIFNVAPGFTLGRDAFPEFETTSTAIFGQVTISATEALRFTVGARYTWDDLEGNVERILTPGAVPVPGWDASTWEYDTDASEPSWRFVAQYDVGQAAMLYASVSRGYKGPTVNILADFIPADPRGILVDPEFATSYELGLKATWLDGRLTTNIAVYDTDFEDFQAQTYDGTTTPGQFRIANAGELSTQGLEVEIMFLATDYLMLSASYAYIDAEYDDFGTPCFVGQTAEQGCLEIPGAPGVFEVDASGKGIPGQIKNSYTLTAYYARPLNDKLDWHLMANYYWRDDANPAPNGDPAPLQEDYGIFNLNVGVGSQDGRWKVSAFAKNLFAKHYVYGTTGTAFFPGSFTQVPAWGSQRELGLSLELSL